LTRLGCPPARNETMEFFAQLVINGLVVGSIYALVAIGFVIIYKSTSVLNFAQGEFLLLGAYVSLVLLTRYRVPFYAAVPLTLAFAVVLGLAIERLILRPMIGEPVVSVIMVTLGLSSILRAVVQGIWGTDTRPFPEIFPSVPLLIGPVPVSRAYVWSFGCVIVLLVLFSLFFKYSRYGIAMRATAFSQQVALSMGISVRLMFALAWAIAAAVSAIGGILLGAVRTGVDQSLALIGLKVLPVVILGGLDSVLGAIVGGLLIGVLENLAGGYLDPVFGGGVKEVAPFVILVSILMIKPYGLFGKVRIERV
jgi:branched-chain amino acid transport system permease protein